MKLLDQPLPFSEALDRLAAKQALPTALSSAEIRAQWSDSLRRRSLFSARTTKAGILQDYQDKLEELLSGKTNMATARMEIQTMFDALGYTPEAGFRGDAGEGIPPAERGTLRDLSSRERVDLVLQTNMRQMANYGFWEQGQSDFALYAFPCYELVRIYPRSVPRGSRLSKGVLEHVEGEDWPSRWEQAGGTFYGDGRMIARKDDEIWGQLGSSELFPDALDTFMPPFAFNSGYGWREVDRAEAVELGVIDEETEVEGQHHGMNEGLEMAAQFSPEFLKAVRADLDVSIRDGKARMAANSGTSEGARKGWETRRGNGWTSAKRAEAQRGLRAINEIGKTKSDITAAMHVPDLGDIDFRWSVGERGMRRIFEDHKIARRIPLRATAKKSFQIVHFLLVLYNILWCEGGCCVPTA